jgi:trehalose 6-phosphate phosphatase
VQPLPERAVPPIPDRPLALFLDFDGTVVDFAETPDEVVPDPGLAELLDALHGVLHGAVAIVSGRPIAALDTLLWPLKLPTAGLHGLERRSAAGCVYPAPASPSWRVPMRAELEHFVSGRPGLLLEDKGVSLALHYRRAPHHEAQVRSLMDALRGTLATDATLLDGNAVVEVRPNGPDKASALAAFLGEQPFVDRYPVYLGDDTSDLVAMRAAKEHGGMAIAVGDRIDATWRLPTPSDARAWLTALIAEHSSP